jgi:hypothetical protein
VIEKITDYQFLNELDQMQRQQITLKTFLGTGCIGDDLPPVVTRAAMSKMKPADAKSGVAKMITRNTKTPGLRKPVPPKAGGKRPRSCGSGPVLKS